MGLSLRNAEDLKKNKKELYCLSIIIVLIYCYWIAKLTLLPYFPESLNSLLSFFIVTVCYACLPCLHIFRLWIALNSTYGLLIFQKGAKGEEGDIGQSGELGSLGTKGTLTRSSQPWSYNSTWNWYIIIMLHQSLHILYNFILWTRPRGQRI